MGDTEQIRNTLGAVLVGGFMCGVLTGAVWMQAALYFRLYQTDAAGIKRLVYLVWFMDSLHTAMVFASNWIYLIDNYGNPVVSDTIPWTIGLTVVLTAFITFLVHCFFVHRVLTLSHRNWWVTGPLVFLAFIRIGAALVSTIEMIKRGTYASFSNNVGFVFTLGLSTSGLLDILISMLLLYYLRRSRTGFSSMDDIIDSLSLYAIENGLATSVVTIISLICWLTMPNNLIFLALHFIISKLYANSFLATLNARDRIRGRTQRSSDNHPMPVRFPTDSGRRGPASQQLDTKLEINVERTIQYDIEEGGIRSSRALIAERTSDDMTSTTRDDASILKQDLRAEDVAEVLRSPGKACF